MKILVLNAGSSSLKYQLFDFPSENIISKGIVENIGSDSFVVHNGKKFDQKFIDHEGALQFILNLLVDKEYGVVSSLDDLDAVGHRVVHGGEKYTQSAIIDDEVIATIDGLSSLAPLHNPTNLKGILAIKHLLPEIKQVAVFDTAFHQTMKPEAYMYALPYELYEKYGIRRYGFHGISHQYVSQGAEVIRNEKLKIKNEESFKLISCHLGNGCSIAAIKDGKVVDTSMGFTPLEGLMMGTRSGDVDPSIPGFLKNQGMKDTDIDQMLNKQSGLLGVSGVSHDMREILDQYDTNSKAKLALDMFVRRIVKYIGSYVAALGGVDMIAFTGGIGERGFKVRSMIVAHLEYLGISLGSQNEKEITENSEIISATDSKVVIAVVPANEELIIAKETINFLD